MLWAHMALLLPTGGHDSATPREHTHTHFDTQKPPPDPSVCADHLWGYTHSHKPPFLLSLFSIILLRAQRWGLRFQSKHRPNSENPDSNPPPVSLSHFLLSHPSFFLLGLCLEERGKRNAGLSEKALAERGSELWGREREETALSPQGWELWL